MMMDDQRVGDLPPGFSFDPTDEELVLYYLKSKIAANLSFNIPHLHFSSSDPSQLNERALWSKNQWYFFSQVKENNNRATGRGYWKELNMNEPIILKNCGEKEKIIGIKKYFVYYITTNIHEQVQTNWIMEEFHLKRENEKLLEWVVCRVHESKNNSEGITCDDNDEIELSALDEVFLSLDDDQEQEEISFPY
ncbi:NAC domain-containing protein 104-like [Solanum stenotomum]|uniref:NAC domain-containing protein 104-like n=1 Tax=Solanum stenotomum TaxID=172797 RepID=UPI0020D01142|nr:NAC domain-containing protein 104-like [Solanum stenotomum]